MSAEAPTTSTESRGRSDREPGSRARIVRWFAFAVPFLCLALTALVLRTLLIERPPTPLPVVPPPLPALTPHVALFVLDGLRYDYATDASKAPNIARRMAAGPSARVVAGQITMTSAAVLSFGTGARGDFAQVVTNLSVARTRQNDLFVNARARGLRTALVGDRTWLDAFGDEGFTDIHTDATGLALDVDNSPEMFAEAEKLLLAPSPPALTVVHFLATDHFGHAFGTKDARYLDMLRRFDARLEEHLSRLGPDMTVVVLSDHGATDTGAHGSDIWSVRQTPLFAFGPGIRRGVRDLAFEQVDLAATLATLIGVPVPAESRGTVATALLDLDAAQIARIREGEARRVAPAIGRREGGQGAGQQEPSGDEPVRAYDRAIVAEKESRGLSASVGIVGLLIAGLLLGGWVAPALVRMSRRDALRWACALCAVALSSIVLTKYVERVVPPFHNVIRAVLFVMGNACLLGWAIVPRRLEALATRFPVTFFALVPGAIALSYTANTQPEAFVAVALLGLAALWRAKATVSASIFVGLLLALHPFGYVNDDPFPAWLAARGTWLAATSVVGLLAYAFFSPIARTEAPRARAGWAVIPLVAFGLSSALKHYLTPPVGITLTLLLPLAAVLAFFRGQTLGARSLVLAAFLLLARDVEVAPVLALATLAEIAAPALGTGSARGIERLLRVTAACLVLFGLSFLARVAIQRGLDFDRLHFGAGAFGSPEPNKIWVGVMMGYRYALVGALLHGAAIAMIPREDRVIVTFGSLVAWFGRSAVLCTMLVIGRTSYWTAQRTISDVSPALILAVTLAGALALVSRPSPTRASR